MRPLFFADLSSRMNAAPQTCPYCNALLSDAPDVFLDQRVCCPRCGEALPDRQPSPIPHGERLQIPVAASPAAGRNTRITAAAVLSAMALMAGIGLVYALYTTGDRRAHDTAMPPPPRRSPLQDLFHPPTAATPPAVTPTTAIRPADLEALRWLPADSTVIAGVQIAELRQADGGLALLNRLFHIGKIHIDPDFLERWTGLKPAEIDHVVMGVKVEDAVPPRTIVVVRTVRPYDVEAVKAALQATPVPEAAPGRKLYQGKPRDGGLRPMVWFADERTLVIGLMSKHLEAVPDRPAEGLERLPAEVRELLRTRLQSGGPAWAVGHCADWRRTGAALLLDALPEKDAALLTHVHDFALQLSADRPATWIATFGCDGEDAAQSVEARLTEAKPPDADWKAVREGAWLTFQLRGDPAALFPRLLRKNANPGE